MLTCFLCQQPVHGQPHAVRIEPIEDGWLFPIGGLCWTCGTRLSEVICDEIARIRQEHEVVEPSATRESR